MACGAYKDLHILTASNKILQEKAFLVASNPHYDGYQRRNGPTVYTFFDKKSRDTPNHTRTEIISENQQLAYKLHSLTKRKFKNAKYIHLMNIMCGMLIFQICN